MGLDVDRDRSEEWAVRWTIPAMAWRRPPGAGGSLGTWHLCPARTPQQAASRGCEVVSPIAACPLALAGQHHRPGERQDRVEAMADPPPVARVGEGGQAGREPVRAGSVQGVEVKHGVRTSDQGGVRRLDMTDIVLMETREAGRPPQVRPTGGTIAGPGK